MRANFIKKHERIEVVIPEDTTGMTEEEISNLPIIREDIFIHSSLWERRKRPFPCKVCNKAKCTRYRRCFKEEEWREMLHAMGFQHKNDYALTKIKELKDELGFDIPACGGCDACKMYNFTHIPYPEGSNKEKLDEHLKRLGI